MPTPFITERPRSAKYHMWERVWFLGSAMPLLPTLPNFGGSPLFMFTPFDVQRPDSAR